MCLNREEAQKFGHVTYTSDKPCVYGHRPVRYTTNRNCVDCAKMFAEKQRASGKRREYQKRNYKNNRQVWDAYYHKNKEQIAQKIKNRVSANQSYYRAKRIQRLYGLTPEQYDQMKVDQNNSCKICEAPLRERDNMAVDHCHRSGKVRGLLCSHCNRGIGHFRDRADLMLKAVEYLK